MTLFSRARIACIVEHALRHVVCTTLLFCTACDTLRATDCALRPAHCALRTMHYALHPVHSTLHATHSTLHATRFTLQAAHWTPGTIFTRYPRQAQQIAVHAMPHLPYTVHRITTSDPARYYQIPHRGIVLQRDGGFTLDCYSSLCCMARFVSRQICAWHGHGTKPWVYWQQKQRDNKLSKLEQ